MWLLFSIWGSSVTENQFQPTIFIEIYEGHIALWQSISVTFENDLKDESKQWYGFVSLDFVDDPYYDAFP